MSRGRRLVGAVEMGAVGQTFCTGCGAEIAAGAEACARCAAPQTNAGMAASDQDGEEGSAPAVGELVPPVGGQARVGTRLLLLGGNVVAGLALVVLMGLVVLSAGQPPVSPGNLSPQFAAPIITYPTPSPMLSTPTATPHPHAPTPTVTHQAPTGSSTGSTPTPTLHAMPTPTPRPPAPTPTQVPPTPVVTPTVGWFQ